MARDEGFATQERAASKRWSVAFSAAFMNFIQTGAFFFTPTTLMPLVVRELGLDFSLSTVPISVGKIMYVLWLLPGGMLVDSRGPRRCVLAGLTGLGVTLALYAAFASSFMHVIVAHIALAIFSSVSGVPVYSLFIAQWFKDGVGLAMGLVLSGYSAAGTAVPAFLGPIASEVGWRVAMGCVSFTVLAVGIPVAYLFLDENEDETLNGFAEPSEISPILVASGNDEKPVLTSTGVHGGPEAGEDSAGNSPTIDEPLNGYADEQLSVGQGDQSWTFMGFALNYMLLQYSFGALGENILFFLTLDRGFSLSFASLFFSILNLSAFMAKLIGGHLGDRYDRFRVAMVTSALAGVGVSLLFWDGHLDDRHVPRLTSSPLALVAFSLTFGFGYGATFNCLYALVPIIFGLKNLGRTQSSLFGIGLIGNALGSIATGVFRSRYGTYDRAFLVAGITTWTNMIVFAVTKHFYAGSIDKAEETAPARLQHEHAVSSHEDIDQIYRSRARLPSGQSIGSTSPGFFAAVFQESPSNDSLLNFGSPSVELGRVPSLPGIDADFQLGPAASSLYGDYAVRHDQDSTLEPLSARLLGGVEFDSGFAYPRTWSSGTLRRIKENKRRRTERRSSPVPVQGDSGSRLAHSITLENLLQSGIMSSSFEDIGYVGSSSSMRRNVTTPNVLELGLSNYGTMSKSHGSLASATEKSPGIPESSESARSKSASGTAAGLPPRRGMDGYRHPRARGTGT